MPVDSIATKLYRDLRSEIEKFMSEPPKYEEVTLPDGFSYYSCVKPRFTLASLGYDYNQYTEKETIRRLEKIKGKITEYLNQDMDEDGYITVDYEVPQNKTKPITNIWQQIRSELQEGENKNTDYVFVVSLP